MRNSRFLIAASVIVSAVVLASSCEKDFLWGGIRKTRNDKSNGIKLNTLSSGKMVETKAGSSAKPANVFRTEDGQFTIEEYVRDIEYTSGAPVTKGTEIITDNLHTACGSFTVDAWAMLSENFPVPDGDKVATQYFKKDYKYSDSVWGWDGEEPTWVTSTPITMWSYAPGSVFDTTPPTVDQTTNKEFEKITFSHTVKKSLEAQEDIIVAYNKETRDFKLEPGYDDRYYYEFHANAADAQIFDDTNNPGNGKVDIHFYHALAAVKFEVDPNAKKGVDVHSITLCYIDNGTKTIVTNDGLATTGDCTVTGPDLDAPTAGTPGTGTAGVSWSNLGGKKPLHYEIPSDKSVRSGYAETGDGVLFMIPQTATNLSVIIEFTAGDANYYARVAEISSVNWQAGKYYTYRLKPAFHLPGELLNGSANTISFQSLKNAADEGLFAFDGGMNSKGVTCIGFLVADYATSLASDHTVFLMLAKNGKDPYIDPGTSKAITGAQLVAGYGTTYTYDTWTDINFKQVESSLADIANLSTPAAIATAVGNIDKDKLIKFGLDSSGNPDGTPETYVSLDKTFKATKDSNGNYAGSGKKSETDLQPFLSKSGPYYFAYRIPENADNNTANDVNTVNFLFKTSAGNSSTGFLAYILGVVVLEIAPDPDLPSNFNTIDWDNI